MRAREIGCKLKDLDRRLRHSGIAAIRTRKTEGIFGSAKRCAIRGSLSPRPASTSATISPNVPGSALGPAYTSAPSSAACVRTRRIADCRRRSGRAECLMHVWERCDPARGCRPYCVSRGGHLVCGTARALVNGRVLSVTGAMSHGPRSSSQDGVPKASAASAWSMCFGERPPISVQSTEGR